MAYEIPQQLEYKEKIIFGLTFKQLAYLFLFAPFIFGIFFKSSLNVYIRFFLSINLSAVAVGFIFLNLDKKIKDIIFWLKTKRIETKEKIAKFIPIKEIKDNLIHTNNKKKIAILGVEPINFSIKPDESKEALTIAFQKFLNSVDFPIQILMNTESLDLESYFKEVDKKIKENNTFDNLFKDYKKHLRDITSEKDVLNRKFYLVIPEKSDIDIQVQICQSKLSNLGVKSHRITNKEIEKLISNFFHTKNNLFPDKIESFPNHIKIGEEFSRTIYAHGYPRSVESGFLDKIVSMFGDFDLSLHVEPHDIETMMVNLNKELQKQRADLYSAKLKGTLNPSLEIKYTDTKAVLKNLQKGKEKLFNVSLYINCRAESLEKLELLTKRIQAELNSLLIIPKQPTFLMARGLQSCMPLAMNTLKSDRNITTEALSAFFPFTSSFLQADKTGVWLGLNKNNIPIIKDIFKLSNPNGLCLASSGSGKSYMAKLLISRYLLNGTKVMVIDPQGEYSPLVKRFNGQRIDLSTNSNSIINPLDLMGHDYSQKRLSLMDLMPIMLGDLTEPQKAFLDKALTEAYEKKGITQDPSSWNNKPPILEDVVIALERYEKRVTTLEKTTIRSLINRLNMYVDGVFSFMNKQTNIDFNNQFVCFDIGNMPKQVKPVVMFLVLDYVYMKMKSDIERKLLVIDEAWSLLGRTEDASYIFEIVKTCRKFNLALFLINQEVEGMLKSEAGKSVLANSSYTLLMRQKPAVIRNIKDTFFLSDSERQHLLTAGVGEGLLLMDDEHSEIKIVASEAEHKIITTNPDELLKQKFENAKPKPKVKTKKKPVKKKVVEIKADENFPVHKQSDLTQEEIKHLQRKKFVQTEQISIVSNKKEAFLIKPRFNESIGHCFMTYDIANYLKKFTKKVELFVTAKPDVVFEINGKKYAIEVETGKVLTKDKKKLIEKVKTLNEEYGMNWFFVVTNRNFYPKYKKFGETFTKKSILNKLNNLVGKNE
jgi:conjugal transfer ATP-binding protein TraC